MLKKCSFFFPFFFYLLKKNSMQSLWRKERQEEEWINHKDERERKGEKRGREIQRFFLKK